jgi:two-component system, LytTR family, sensor kinase
MKKSIVTTLHILYWAPNFTVIVINLSMILDRGSTNPTFYMPIVTAGLSFIFFYLSYFYLFPTFLAKKRISNFIILGLAAWIVLSALGWFILRNLAPDNYSGRTIGWVIGIAPSILFSGINGSLFKGFITWYSEIRMKEQLVQKNLQSELALLKAQINPHFLFNTINNIDVLIEKDPRAASKYLKQLSEIMRFMLYEASTDLIPLTTELEYITKYIELQKIRTSNERFVTLTISGENEKLMIAPAIFIPFIENAFKHSTNKKIADAITVMIKISGNDISFTCRNYYDISKTFSQEKSGLGIDLIKQRLKLLYDQKHQLDITKTENQYEIILKIISG